MSCPPTPPCPNISSIQQPSPKMVSSGTDQQGGSGPEAGLCSWFCRLGSCRDQPSHHAAALTEEPRTLCRPLCTLRTQTPAGCLPAEGLQSALTAPALSQEESSLAASAVALAQMQSHPLPAWQRPPCSSGTEQCHTGRGFPLSCDHGSHSSPSLPTHP